MIENKGLKHKKLLVFIKMNLPLCILLDSDPAKQKMSSFGREKRNYQFLYDCKANLYISNNDHCTCAESDVTHGVVADLIDRVQRLEQQN